MNRRNSTLFTSPFVRIAVLFFALAQAQLAMADAITAQPTSIQIQAYSREAIVYFSGGEGAPYSIKGISPFLTANQGPTQVNVFLGVGVGGDTRMDGSCPAPGTPAHLEIADRVGNTQTFDFPLTCTNVFEVEPKVVQLKDNSSVTFKITGKTAYATKPYVVKTWGKTFGTLTSLGPDQFKFSITTCPADPSKNPMIFDVVDSNQAVAHRVIKIQYTCAPNKQLALSPTSGIKMQSPATIDFKASGGVAPYQIKAVQAFGMFTQVAGSTDTARLSVVTCPPAATPLTLNVKDAEGDAMNFPISYSCTDPIALSPTTKVSLVEDKSTVFTASGGTGGYQFALGSSTTFGTLAPVSQKPNQIAFKVTKCPKKTGGKFPDLVVRVTDSSAKSQDFTIPYSCMTQATANSSAVMRSTLPNK